MLGRLLRELFDKYHLHSPCIPQSCFSIDSGQALRRSAAVTVFLERICHAAT